MEEVFHPYGLSLYDNGKLVANDQNFRDKIGQWTFISIAYHKEKKKIINIFFPKMMKFYLVSKFSHLQIFCFIYCLAKIL